MSTWLHGRTQRTAIATAGSLLVLALATCSCGGSQASSTTTQPPTTAKTTTTTAASTATTASASTATSRSSPTGHGADLASLLPGNIRTRGQLNIATSAEYPPFEYVGTNGKTLIGLDIDLGNALAKLLGVRAHFVNVAGAYATVIPGVQSGRYDMAITGMGDTAARETSVNFVDYFHTGTAILVQAGNPDHISGFSDLCGKNVGAAESTPQVAQVQAQSTQCASGHHAAIKPLVLARTPDEILALENGRISAFEEYAPSAHYQEQTSPTKLTVVGPEFAYSAIGIPVAKTSTQLEHALQVGIQTLMDNGTYGKILHKWAQTSGAIPKATINATG